MKRSRMVAVVGIAIVVCIAFASQAARFLVVDDPVKSDAIVVLAGETNARPAHALDLLHEGLAQHVFLDTERGSLIYDELLVDIGRRYIEARGEASRVSVCPVFGSSTFAEVDDASHCLQEIGAHRVLIVTSEFHTRRALMIFRHRLPQYEIHVAAAYSPFQFGEKWWTHREWAKTTFDEWIKMTWFQIADRWR